MTAFLAIVAGLAGGVAGYFLGFLLYISIATALGVPDREGGLAMGAAFVVGPLGALAGIILCATLVLISRRPKTTSHDEDRSGSDTSLNVGSEQPAANPQQVADEDLLDPTRDRTKESYLGQIVLTIVLIAAGLGGVGYYVFYEPPAPIFGLNVSKPVVEFEFRVPTASMAGNTDFMPWAQLDTHKTSLNADRLKSRVTGNETVFSGRITLQYRVKKRILRLWLTRKSAYVFDLPFDAIPIAEPALSSWRRVDRIEYRDKDLTDIKPVKKPFFVRTRVVWPGGN